MNSSLSQGSTLQGGTYRIERVLGQGGFGITYLAEQVIVVKGGLGEIESTVKVSIKEFFMKSLCNRASDASHVSVGSDGSNELVNKFKSKFIKEAQNISKLRHNNIIKVLDIFEENDTAYYVMEYIDGGTLAEKVKQYGAMSEIEAKHYIRQLAASLGYIHEMKINHLDVKPGNVLIKNSNTSVLIDFGLSKQYDSAGEQTSTTPVGVSKGYAPMEQYKSGGVSSFSPATDIYSLGATLYNLVTGLTPPEAHDVFDSGLPELPAELSVSVKNAITKAMQPSRGSRPQSVAAFLEILGGAVVSDDAEDTVFINKTTSTPVHTPSPTFDPEPDLEPISDAPKKDLTKIVLCVVLVLLVLVSAYLYYVSTNRGGHYDAHGQVDSVAVCDAQAYEELVQDTSADVVEKPGVADQQQTQQAADRAEQQRIAAEQTQQAAARAEQQRIATEQQEQQEQEEAESRRLENTQPQNSRNNPTSAKAQYNLACRYFDNKRTSDAVKWYRKSAEQGYMSAQYNLAYCYSNGIGTNRDYAEAAKWYGKAASQGDADAQCNLGLCYKRGQGVSQSDSQAFYWYSKAALQGNTIAQYNLGNSYRYGSGVAENYDEAVRWYRKAAAQGNNNAISALEELNEY